VYIPEAFREERPEVLHDFIRRHPFGALICTSAEGLTANHIPMILAVDASGNTLLHGHVARANSVWKSVAPGASVLVIFGGAQHYITPSWYPAKQEHGKVVPTWNYSVVHAHGTIHFQDDKEQTRQYVTQLTDQQEAARSDRWRVTDAPPKYVDTQLSAIVGFEIKVQRLTAKFKASQHRPEEERASVRQALEGEGVSADDRAEVVRDPKKVNRP
jgi:transcriptional regulator